MGTGCGEVVRKGVGFGLRLSLRVVGCVAVLAAASGGLAQTDLVTHAQADSDVDAVLADTPPGHDVTTGTLAGEASTEGAASTYRVSIVVPPGRAGMQPSLGLTYNSRSGDGVMGLGWSISGLSSIHRCPQTPEQDAASRAVDYTNSDRLCLDGQRLVPRGGASYGAIGTTYATEIDSYARITQAGGDLSGSAACFKVEEKSGRILHYGGVVSGSSCLTPTRVQPTGAAATLTWPLVKVEDRVGNNQIYSYSNVGNGEVLISNITYTGYGSDAGDRSVAFTYVTRASAASGATDIASSYLYGGLTMQTRALSSITTYAAGARARRYFPTYAAAAHSGRLIVTRLSECGASDSTCHPATRFTYNDGPLDFPKVSLAGTLPSVGANQDPAYANPNQITVIADLDGDGTREAEATVVAADGTHQYLVQMTGDRQVHTAIDLTGTRFAARPELYADLDGDGRAELLEAGVGSTLTIGVWKGARGVPASDVVGTGQTPQQNFDDLFQPFSSTIPAGQYFTGDFDGDGRIDIAVVRADANYCGPSDSLGAQYGIFIYRNTMTGKLGSPAQPGTGFATPSGAAACLNRTWNFGTGVYYAPEVDHVADFDGDGIPDFYLVNAGSNSSVAGSFAGIQLIHPNVTNPSEAPISPLVCSTSGGADECDWSRRGYVAHWMDINGDGLEDFVFARPGDSSPTWLVRLNKGGGSLAPIINTGSSEGLAKDANDSKAGFGFRYANSLPVMDVDGDGKPDLLIPSKVQGIHGFALKMCTIKKVQPFTTETCFSAQSPMDSAPVSPDVGATCAAYACPPNPDDSEVTTPCDPAAMPCNSMDNPFYPYQWNGLPAFSAYSNNSRHGGTGDDNSVYHLAMLKFVQTGSASARLDLIETPLMSRLKDAHGRTEDLFGDGLEDLLTSVGCANITVTNGKQNQQGYWSYPLCSVVGDNTYGPNKLPDGTATANYASSVALYANLNQGVDDIGGSPDLVNEPVTEPSRPTVIPSTRRAPILPVPILPELMNSVKDGLGDWASWGYYPLSVPAEQAGIDFYSVAQGDDYSDQRHYYFQSSMPAVFGMLKGASAGADGDSSSVRSALYGYANAMYNHFGRGFQGFETIVAENGQFLRTTTNYHQKFPLTGRVKSIDTQWTDIYGTSLHWLAYETDAWICTLSTRAACPTGDSLPPSTGNTIYAPQLDRQLVYRYDLNSGALLSHTDTVNAATTTGGASGWDSYGNLTKQVVSSADNYSSDRFVDNHVVTTSNTYLSADTTAWWLDRLQDRTVATTIAYNAAHALPSGASAPSRTVSTTYNWNSPSRTLNWQTVQSGVTNQQRTTTYGYPSTNYGLPTSMTVSAPSASPSTRTTTYTYTKNGISASADGYFVYTTTNPLSQTTTTKRSISDGQVTRLTDPNGLEMVRTYDTYGRLNQTQFLDAGGGTLMPPQTISLTRCSGTAQSTCSGGYGEDGQQGFAAYRMTTVQSGYPTQVDWIDALGRTVKHVERGLGGSLIETINEYNIDGDLSMQSTPFLQGGVPYLTAWNYDLLHRPVEKEAPGAELDPGHGNVKTTYTYSGPKTAIKVRAVSVSGTGTCPSGTNLCMDMTRYSDVLGHLVKTTQALNGSAGYATTKYWYDGVGNAVAIQDPENNVLKATYNDIGQRGSVQDPDAGTTSFGYDALDELLTQTDARGITTVHTYDALGRLRQRTATNSGSADASLKVIRDTWQYDPVGSTGGAGLLDYAKREKGASTSALSQIWKESNLYEPQTKRLNSLSTTLDGQSSTWSTQYDYDSYGRIQTTTYPSGLAVHHGYTAYGFPNALSNDSTGAAYWSATAADAWGNITAETYLGSITGAHSSYASTGQSKHRQWNSGSALLDQLDYSYDSFGNLKSQDVTAASTDASESYGYDALQRLTSAARSGVPGNPPAVTYQYTAGGNLSAKSDFSLSTAGSYQYGTNGCGPHGVSRVSQSTGTLTYTCDASGNVIGGSGTASLSANYDFNNQPWQVVRSGAGVAQFAYSANGDVFEQQTTSQSSWFGPAGYEVTQIGSQSYQRHELGPVIVLRQNGADTVQAVLRDRLGSQVMLASSGTSSVGAPTLGVSPSPSLDGHYTMSWTSVSGATVYQLKEQANGGAEHVVYSGSGLTWSPPSAKSVGSYSYRVVACNGSCGSDSNTVVEQVAPWPATSISGTPNPSTTGSYTLSWATVAGAQSYALEELVGGSWIVVANGSATSLGVAYRPDGSYSYRVRACATVCGSYSATYVEIVQTGGGISPPATITVSPNPSTTGAYTVSWSVVSTATSYKLQESTTPNVWVDAGTVTSPSRAFSGRSNGSYSYRVQACAGTTCSGYSSTVTELVQIPGPPGIPQNLVASPDNSLDGSYTVSWSAVSGSGISYRLEESTTPNEWNQVASQSGTSWSTSGRADGQYVYRVRACNTVCGDYSATYTETVRLVPDIPTGFTVGPNPSTGSLTASWDVVSSVSWYQLDERLNGGSWTQVLDNGTLHGPSTTFERGNGSYEFKLKACVLGSQVRCSDYTQVVSVTVSGSGTPPAPATISGPSYGCVGSPRSYTISWAPSQGATSYELHEWSDAGLDQVLTSSTTFQDLERTRAGTGYDAITFSYEVRACAGGQCSPYRGTVSVCVGYLNLIRDADVTVVGTAYDAFGKVRNGDLSERANGTLDLLPETQRGFTGHTHVDDVRLIHMNGRVYDYQLGRFLSVDPVIQFPSNSQSLNPYSYILNNPLAGTDPTGYAEKTESGSCDTATGTHICGYVPGGSNGQSTQTKTITDSQSGQRTTYTKTVTASGTTIFAQISSSGARTTQGTKPAGQTDGSKGGASGIDGQEHDPGQQQQAKRAALGRAFGEVGEEVLNAVNPGDPVNLVAGIVAGKVVRLGKDVVERGLDTVTQKLLGEKAAQEGLEGVLSRFWTRSEVNGTRVYQRSDLIDASLVDARGRTNLQRMQSGLAPIGPDGESINLHHMLQTQNSPLAEMTRTFHETYSRVLHINPNTIPSGIDRAAWHTQRESYWMERAKDFQQ